MRHSKALFAAFTCAWMILLHATAASAADASLAGSWELQITSPQGTRTPTMKLTQTGNQISGTYRSSRGEVPIAGTVQGNEFALTVRIAGQNDTLVVEYRGRIDGDALSGRVMMGSRGEANFTGKRLPAS